MTREQIIQIFNSWTYSGFRDFYERWADYLKYRFMDDYSYRIEPSIVYPAVKDSIMVFEVRCNEDISFNNQIRNNDLLLVAEVVDDASSTLSIALHKFNCTTDPCSKKYRIAHTARQIYRGNVGIHRNNEGRLCIRSDHGFGTYIRRTDGDGEILKINGHVDAYPDHVGINIHDNGGFANSSLGCTILAGADYLHPGPYRDEFKPLLVKCSNKENIPVALIDAEDVEDIIKWDAHKAIRENPSECPLS